MTTATAYELDRNLETQERGAVSIEQALEIIDARLACLEPTYESGEEALSETMFGFSRADDEFIELCMHTHDHVSCRIELPSLSGIFEEELESREAVARRVRGFFALAEPDFAESLKSGR